MVIRIKDHRGELEALWRGDSGTIELVLLEASKIGNKFGSSLMEEFLSMPEVKAAKYIILFPEPWQGLNANSDEDADRQLEKLRRFYERFGFVKLASSSKSPSKVGRFGAGAMIKEMK